MNNKEKETQNVCEQEELCAQQKFLNDLKATNSAYVYVLIISAVLIGGAIALAVLLNVFAGLAVGIAAVLLYMLLTKRLLEKNLGISYISTPGALTITSVKANGREEIFIPSSVIRTAVTEIGSKAFSSSSSSCIKSVHIPASIVAIGANVFEGCSSLKTVYFEGSESEWEEIESETDLSGYEILFNDPSQFEIIKTQKSADEECAGSDNGEENTAEDGDK